MELDELKKSWKTLDSQLQNATITNGEQVSELICRHKEYMSKNLNKLVRSQRLSMYIGGGIAALIIVCMALLCFYLPPSAFRIKAVVLLLFFVLSIVVAVWWDNKTLRWVREIRVDEMSVKEVAIRMFTYKRWIRSEIVLVGIWAVLFTCCYYWVIDFYENSWGLQVAFFVITFLIDACLLYFLYKKTIFKHIKNIHINIDELKDICTE